MKVLLVAATPFEFASLRSQAAMAEDEDRLLYPNLDIRWLVTGIGMVNTAYQLGQAFAHARPDLAIQVGIAGAFVGGPEIGEVVEVATEMYPELGADSPEGFLGLEQMGFGNFKVNEHTYYNVLQQPRAGLVGWKQCRGVTVNRVSGTANGIAALAQQWQPQVESMEGAAFFQACLLAGVPFRQIRAISNRVEPRDRSKWRMQEAIAALNQTVGELLYKASENLSIL